MVVIKFMLLKVKEFIVKLKEFCISNKETIYTIVIYYMKKNGFVYKLLDF